MNLWQKIVSLSGLPECRSIAEHLCNAKLGGETVYIDNKIDLDIVSQNNQLIIDVVEDKSDLELNFTQLLNKMDIAIEKEEPIALEIEVEIPLIEMNIELKCS